MSIPFVPPFSFDIPTWLALIEEAWRNSNISEDQKYQAVIRALLTEIFASITLALPTLSPEARYEGLKAAITAVHGRTTIQSFKELIPSQTTSYKYDTPN
ncbi:hypothetical protein Pmani_007010 [Petrolisthes manimaculis]|uniref:Uncharacterized protein n=1 Tax=Petrolisthes manimaculis TaxID=1843537 RepID=A0AAE1QBQ0_9EUCA|nr:hypothetical protein Pmani_007010 [Petrolisthes manimaculis]